MRWTSSQLSVDALAPQICSRTSGWKISAPPPGRLPRPASIRSLSTVSTGLRAILQNHSISTAVYALTWISARLP